MPNCSFENCNANSTYGIKQFQVTRCKIHKLDGMVTKSNLYCNHNKRKNRCKQCGGSQICEHDKEKSRCVQCNGASICEHKIRRENCFKCKGSATCIHNKIKNVCFSCNGNSICIHKKRKSQCKDCNGSSICIHKIHRSKCLQCKGSSICTHIKERMKCRICSPDSNYFCKECHFLWGNRKYKGYCVPCYVYKFPDDELAKNAHLKHNELKVKAFLANEFPGVFTHNSRIWFGDCTAPYRRFLDFYVMVGNTLFVIEVDEHQHRGYDIEDEKSRINEILHNIGLDKKMVFIRYNPDTYKVDSKRKITSVEDRLKTLKDTVVEILEILYDNREYNDIHTEIKLFYDN